VRREKTIHVNISSTVAGVEGLELNDLHGIILPPLGIRHCFIYRGRSGTWQFGGVEPMVYIRWSPRGVLQWRRVDHGDVMELKKL
jgi:hypothetical protein